MYEVYMYDKQVRESYFHLSELFVIRSSLLYTGVSQAV